MKHASVVLAILFLALATAPLTSESFRVRSVTTLEVSGNDSETRIANIGYNDAVGILFPENTIFLRAVEIEIRIPREILRYQNSMAYGVYRNVEPAPKSGVIDYRGIQEVYQPLPARLSFVLQIPWSPITNSNPVPMPRFSNGYMTSIPARWCSGSNPS